MSPPRRPLADRFAEMVAMSGPNDCWLWTGPVRKRYGSIGAGGARGRTLRANRVAWELANKRSVPDGLVVRHTCDVPLCCNPAHLVLGTVKQNNGDAVERGRHVRGAEHPLSRLSEADVTEIRGLLVRERPQREIATRFGVSQRLIAGIKAGTHWRPAPTREETK